MRLFWLSSVATLLFLIAPYRNATEEYAEKTGKSCEYCHLDSSGRGKLTKAGQDFFQRLFLSFLGFSESAFILLIHLLSGILNNYPAARVFPFQQKIFSFCRIYFPCFSQEPS
jgi:hypothetical protein